LTDIRYIEFTGGEPFLIQEHFDMLQGIVDRGIASQVEIHYNTNGTQYPEHAEEIWKHFKTVEIAVSIDDIAERFEYQRTNAVWTEVVVNLSRFKELRAKHANIQLQCCTTVNVFNVRYLADVAHFIVHQGFDFVYWNMLHDAPQFSIATLPESAKVEIAAYLRNCNPPLGYRAEFDRICEFMFNGTSTDGSALRDEIIKVDLRRKQRLKDIAPELASLIDYK
jgi:sulfatase maturation enzyme AslB (radical SAM superfamily)